MAFFVSTSESTRRIKKSHTNTTNNVWSICRAIAIIENNNPTNDNYALACAYLFSQDPKKHGSKKATITLYKSMTALKIITSNSHKQIKKQTKLFDRLAIQAESNGLSDITKSLKFFKKSIQKPFQELTFQPIDQKQSEADIRPPSTTNYSYKQNQSKASALLPSPTNYSDEQNKTTFRKLKIGEEYNKSPKYTEHLSITLKAIIDLRKNMLDLKQSSMKIHTQTEYAYLQTYIWGELQSLNPKSYSQNIKISFSDEPKK